jgi:hypothetical protein
MFGGVLHGEQRSEGYSVAFRELLRRAKLEQTGLQVRDRIIICWLTGILLLDQHQHQYSNEYLAKLKNTNYDDIEGVAGMSMTHRPSNIKVEGDYFITNIDKAEQALAVTRPHIWAHGNSSNVYFAKAAFRSKEQLSYTMAHEFGHVIHNSLGLGTLSNSKLGTPITGIDNEGHFAIGVMTNRLIKTNGWKGLGTFNFGYDQPMDNLYEPIKTLIRKIKLP